MLYTTIKDKDDKLIQTIAGKDAKELVESCTSWARSVKTIDLSSLAISDIMEQGSTTPIAHIKFLEAVAMVLPIDTADTRKN